MKDKIVKNHHKGIYYKMRRFAIASILIFTAGTFVAIPTYISTKESKATNEESPIVEVSETALNLQEISL